MDRRQFLYGGASFGVAQVTTICGVAQGAGSQSQLPNLIDAHCHVFNARDLPMIGFIEKAVLPNNPRLRKQAQEYSEAIDHFLRYLAEKLNGSAFTATSEVNHLDDIERDKRRKRTAADIAKDEIDFLTGLIEDLKSRQFTGPRMQYLPALAPVVLVGLMHREAYPTLYWVKGYDRGALLNNADDAFSSGQWQPSGALAERLYRYSDGPIGYYLRWGALLTRYRYELVEELHKIHHGRAFLLTPALIDYSKWLDVPDPTAMQDQVHVMARIARHHKADPTFPHVHGFVAFDPLRQAISEKLDKPAATRPLAIVQDAIEKNGFIGVKLYPPMGFRPANNVAAGDDFPCSVRYGSGSAGYRERCENPTHAEDALGNNPGRLLDEKMDQLFQWCSARNVPIMSHSNNSYGVGPAYGTRANPKHWQPVLNRYPNLRLNLAHFGGFDEAFDEDGEVHDNRLESTWEWEVGKLLKPFSNVYADVSYFNELLNSDACKSDKNCARETVRRFFKRFLASFPEARNRLIYGSDWIMTGIERKFPSVSEQRLYPDIVAGFLNELGLSVQDVMLNNINAFLGLKQADRLNGTRGRLEKFYADNGLDAKWFEAFDIV